MSCDQVCRTRPARSILHPQFEECRALCKRGHCQRSKVGGSHLSPDQDATLFVVPVLVDRLGFRLPVPRSWCKVYGGDFEHLSKKQAEWVGKECCPELTSKALSEIFCAVSFEWETEA